MSGVTIVLFIVMYHGVKWGQGILIIANNLPYHNKKKSIIWGETGFFLCVGV